MACFFAKYFCSCYPTYDKNSWVETKQLEESRQSRKD